MTSGFGCVEHAHLAQWLHVPRSMAASHTSSCGRRHDSGMRQIAGMLRRAKCEHGVLTADGLLAGSPAMSLEMSPGIYGACTHPSTLLGTRHSAFALLPPLVLQACLSASRRRGANAECRVGWRGGCMLSESLVSLMLAATAGTPNAIIGGVGNCRSDDVSTLSSREGGELQVLRVSPLEHTTPRAHPV